VEGQHKILTENILDDIAKEVPKPDLSKPTPSKKITATNKGELGLDIYTLGNSPQAILYDIIIFGNPGVGKTLLSATASDVPELSPVLFANIEGGTLTLKYDYPNLDIVNITTVREMFNVFKVLANNPGKYKTLIIDSITALQALSVQELANKRVKEGKIDDPNDRDWVVWHGNDTQTKRIVRAFEKAGVNVIFTALEKVDKDEKTGRSFILPDMVGKTAYHTPGNLDFVWRLSVSKGKRVLLTREKKNILAKSRLNKNNQPILPEIIEDPNFTRIMELINNV